MFGLGPCQVFGRGQVIHLGAASAPGFSGKRWCRNAEIGRLNQPPTCLGVQHKLKYMNSLPWSEPQRLLNVSITAIVSLSMLYYIQIKASPCSFCFPPSPLFLHPSTFSLTQGNSQSILVLISCRGSCSFLTTLDMLPPPSARGLSRNTRLNLGSISLLLVSNNTSTNDPFCGPKSVIRPKWRRGNGIMGVGHWFPLLWHQPGPEHGRQGQLPGSSGWDVGKEVKVACPTCGTRPSGYLPSLVQTICGPESPRGGWGEEQGTQQERETFFPKRFSKNGK